MSVSKPEMDEWAALWAEPDEPDEREQVRALAMRASRRARLASHADLIIGVLIAAAVLFALIARPEPVTIAVGLVAAFGLLWSSWERHQLKQRIRELVQIDDRADLIELRTARVRTELQRAVAGLVALPPVVLLFAMLTQSIQAGGSLSDFDGMLLRALTHFPVGPAIIAAILALLVQQARSVLSLRRELGNLRVLGGQYEQEAKLDRAALS